MLEDSPHLKLPQKHRDLRKNCIMHKTCVFNFSTTFTLKIHAESWNVSEQLNKYSESNGHTSVLSVASQEQSPLITYMLGKWKYSLSNLVSAKKLHERIQCFYLLCLCFKTAPCRSYMRTCKYSLGITVNHESHLDWTSYLNKEDKMLEGCVEMRFFT